MVTSEAASKHAAQRLITRPFVNIIVPPLVVRDSQSLPVAKDHLSPPVAEDGQSPPIAEDIHTDQDHFSSRGTYQL